MLFNKVLIASLLVSSLSGMAMGKTWSCKKWGDGLPVVVEGCQGEACSVILNTLSLKEVEVKASYSAISATVGTLKKCENFGAPSIYNLISQYGAGEVKVLNEGFKKAGVKIGDIVPLTLNFGEGFFVACIDDQEIMTSVFGNNADATEGGVSLLNHPVAQEWVKVTLPSGLSGYVHSNNRFYMGLYDYDENLLCPGDNGASR